MDEAPGSTFRSVEGIGDSVHASTASRVDRVTGTQHGGGPRIADSRTGREPDTNSFRRDVQGLRGIAVLLVVLFHAGVGLSGGYVGVDVFFVISGFIIARMLLVELDHWGTIDLRRFYARRIKRLLPAIAAATTATLQACCSSRVEPRGGLRGCSVSAR